MNEGERAAVVNIISETIEAFTCFEPEGDCTAEITTVCENTNRRQVSGSWQIDYAVLEIFTCEVASCSSARDSEIATVITERISQGMTTVLDEARFLIALSRNVQLTLSFSSQDIPTALLTCMKGVLRVSTSKVICQVLQAAGGLGPFREQKGIN